MTVVHLCWKTDFQERNENNLTHLVYVPSGTSGMESELEAAKGDEEKEQVEDNVDELDDVEGVCDQGSEEDEHPFEDS